MALAAWAIASLLVVWCWFVSSLIVPSVKAETASLSVAVDRSLSLVGESLAISVAAQLPQPVAGATLEITLVGPVAAGQIGLPAVDAAPAQSFKRQLWTDPNGFSSSAAAPFSVSSTSQELAAGNVKAALTIPGSTPATAGAYVVTAAVKSGGTLLATASTWLGKVGPRNTPLDVSFVLPVFLGIHRDWTGRFFDQTLEQATLPVESGSATLRGLVPLAEALPQWRFTVAVEPILLTQLRDMADGYVYSEDSSDQTDIAKNDLEAQNAAATIAELAALAGKEPLEVVVSPYTGANLDLLAAEGWRDGLEQIQMGKQELQSTLGLTMPLSGAYVPGLDTSGEALAFYADASVDHVVVGSDVASSLAESVAPGTATVRAENVAGDRVTLVLAASAIAAVMQAPWDANVFSAALAAELASNNESALVIAPRDPYAVLPLSYVQQIGQTLTNQPWIRTQKLQELISLYSPNSRPVQFVATGKQPEGYIETRLLASVREAHVLVNDLATAADTTKAAVDLAHQLLYVAESRWWSREGTSPSQASMGLAYAAQAEAAAKEELGKVHLVKVSSPLMTSGEGVIKLTIENSTKYVITGELKLSGEGVTFPDTEALRTELQPGRTELEVRVASDGGSHLVKGSLLIGTTVVDDFSHTVRFVGIWGILAWVLPILGLLAAGGGYLLVRRRLRKGRGDEVQDGGFDDEKNEAVTEDGAPPA